MLLIPIIILLVVIVFVVFLILRKKPQPAGQPDGDPKRESGKPSRLKNGPPPLVAPQYSIFNSDDLLQAFYDILNDLESDPLKLKEARNRYNALQAKCTHLQGMRESIIRQAIPDSVVGKFSPNEQSYILRAMTEKLNIAYEPYSREKRREEWKQCFEKLTLLLRVHVIFTVPFLANEPRGSEKNEIDDFVGRGHADDSSINEALKFDREIFTAFMKNEHKSFVSSLFDETVGRPKTGPYQVSLKKTKHIENLVKGSNLANLPPETEIVIYFAGHSQKGTGNWLFFDQEGKPEPVALEEILEWWTSQPQAKVNHLTIIADCCFSGQWVNLLRDDEKFEEYREYPICIQSACLANEEAYESTLVPLLTGVEPKIIGQNPQFFRTKSHFTKMKFINFDESILDVPAKIFNETRSDLKPAQDEQFQACKRVISYWENDEVASNKAKKNLVVLDEEDEFPDWLQNSTRVNVQAPPHPYEKRSFANLQVKTGGKGTEHETATHSQIFVQVGPNFIPHRRRIKNAFLWSLQKQVPCWLFPTSLNKPNIVQYTTNKRGSRKRVK